MSKKILNIVVFGSSKQGKSSFINGFTGSNFKVSNDLVGTTCDAQASQIETDSVIYRFHDTAGLDETECGTVPTGVAILKIIQLIQLIEETGICLFIICMKNGPQTNTMENFKLFYNIIGKSRIPIIAVLTCRNEISNPNFDLGNFKSTFRKHFDKMAIRDVLPVDHQDPKSLEFEDEITRWELRRERSNEYVMESLEKYATDNIRDETSQLFISYFILWVKEKWHGKDLKKCLKKQNIHPNLIKQICESYSETKIGNSDKCQLM